MKMEYTTEQQSAIDEATAELNANLADREFLRFVDVDRAGELRERNGEWFAVFGDTAYKIVNGKISDDRAEFEYLPALVEGHLIGQFPDEGSSGVLHIMRCLRHKTLSATGWHGVYLQLGYLHTAELDQSNQQILENIADEIENGETPLTGGGLPGWIK